MLRLYEHLEILLLFLPKESLPTPTLTLSLQYTGKLRGQHEE